MPLLWITLLDALLGLPLLCYNLLRSREAPSTPLIDRNRSSGGVQVFQRVEPR